MCISGRIGMFVRGQRGNVLLETALVQPLILMMLAGVLDVGRLLLMIQKMDKAAATYADLVARENSVTTSSLGELFKAVEHVTSPYDFSTDGVAFISSVKKNVGGPAEVVWQHKEGGLGGKTSQVGAVTSVPNLPAGFTLADGDTAIVGEIYYQWTPIFFPEYITELLSDSSKWNSTLGGFELYYYHYFRPRTVIEVPCTNC